MASPTFLGSNINQVKEHNLRAILRYLLHEGPLSRIQLSQKTLLSATTITNLVEELLEQHILNECTTRTPSEERRVGRPRSALCLSGSARFAIGVHMRVGIYRVALVDLFGHVIDFQQECFTNLEPAQSVIINIARSIELIIQRQQIDRSTILGVGIGASGLVNYRSGVNIQAANFGWKDVPMRDQFTELLHLPVVVDNNVRCMALGESMFGAGQGVNSLVFIYGRFGVGAGIIMDGKIVRGSGQGAGEIGHTILFPGSGTLCRCGQRGCLEPLVSEPSLISQAQMAADLHPGSTLAKCMQLETDLQPIKRLFLAYRQNDPVAKDLVETSAWYLGIAISNLVNVINPDLILLGGLFHDEQEIYLPITRAVMMETSFGGLGQNVRLEATTFGWQAGMIGAGALALAKFFYFNPENV